MGRTWRPFESLRMPSFWVIFSVLLLLAAIVTLKCLPHDFGGGTLVASLSSAWQGEFQRTPAGITASEGEAPFGLDIRVQLKRHAKYVFELATVDSPPLDLDFQALGKKSNGVRIEVPATGGESYFVRSVQWPGLSEECLLLIHAKSDRPVTISYLRVYEVAELSTKIRWLLKGLLMGAALMSILSAACLVGGKRLLIAAALFVSVLMIYVLFSHCPAGSQSGDNMWYIPTAQQLLRAGNINLSQHAELIKQRDYYGIRNAPRYGLVNFFPMGTSLLALPFVFAGKLIGLDESQLFKYTAQIWAALSVVLIFWLGVRFRLSHFLAGTVALVFGLASSHLSVHAGGLWSHNTSLLLSLIVVLLLTSDQAQCVLLAAPVAVLGYITRPDFSLLIAGSLVYVGIRHRDLTVGFLALLAVSIVPFLIWSYYFFGQWLPPYYQGGRLNWETWAQALTGQLLSPNRGLVIFNPIVILSFWGMVLAWFNHDEFHSLFRIISLVFLAFVVTLACFPHWWGGHSYGPRLYSPMLGLLTLSVVPAIHWIKKLKHDTRIAVVMLCILAIGWGGFVHFRGARAWSVYAWNVDPINVDVKPERSWDWSDMQVFR
ncbi:MAG: hypothetical protein HQK58_04305 [Deltaproteobacteria bacterium]|nr:hypothetical protein [Deltaproteobacteria bacterium]